MRICFREGNSRGHLGIATGPTTPLPLSTWDRDTLRAVALAYRRVRRLGERDLPVRYAADRAYIERHPAAAADEAQRRVGLMISAVARDRPDIEGLCGAAYRL